MSRRRVLTHHPTDTLLVLGLVLLEQVVGFSLRRRLGIRVVEQVLHAEENLLDGDCGLPRLVLVQDGQADRSGWVDVGVEQRRDEFAWREKTQSVC